jgi:hypothetical protein
MAGSDVVCDSHRTRGGDEKHIFSSLGLKTGGYGVSGLASKPLR